MTTGFVLFAHGARDPRWAATVEGVAQRLGVHLPGVPVRCAYLEFMTPDLSAAVDSLVADGVRTVVVAPVFLATGGHLQRDLPQLVSAAEARHAGISVRVLPALGGLAPVLDAMARACADALAGAPSTDAPSAGIVPAREKKGVDAR
jgi:sirohydrochlorin cobaltochelatase